MRPTNSRCEVRIAEYIRIDFLPAQRAQVTAETTSELASSRGLVVVAPTPDHSHPTPAQIVLERFPFLLFMSEKSFLNQYNNKRTTAEYSDSSDDYSITFEEQHIFH